MTINIVIFVAVSLFRLMFLEILSRMSRIFWLGWHGYGGENSNIRKYLHMLFYAVCFLELLLKKPALTW